MIHARQEDLMQRPRTPSRISESLHRQLNSYALAASAAGVSLLALAAPAEARIIYTSDHRYFGNHLHLDLNNDRVVDFAVWSTLNPFRLYLNPRRHNAVLNTQSCWTTASHHSRCGSIAAQLSYGAKIGPSAKWEHKGAMRICSQTTTSRHSFCNRLWSFGSSWDAYLGLKFQLKGKVHYGWDHVKRFPNGDLRSLGYAYETIPNKPIIAGKTHGKDVITLDSASLGHLARGASAIPAWRGKD